LSLTGCSLLPAKADSLKSRGGRALIFEGATGRILRNEAITDGAGVEALDGGDFLVTTGQGKLIRMGTCAPAQELATLPLHWDNHLV
jgi:hypothetical protein